MAVCAASTLRRHSDIPGALLDFAVEVGDNTGISLRTAGVCRVEDLMLRLVVIHQLVLSLIVGPILCCCTTAHLRRDANATARTARSVEEPLRKLCCGQQPKPSNGGRHSQDDSSPGDPSKCPCKDNPKVVAVAEVSTVTADLSSLLSASAAPTGLPVTWDGLVLAAQLAPRFEHRSASVSTSDLLFAHHKLRC